MCNIVKDGRVVRVLIMVTVIMCYIMVLKGTYVR